VSDGVASTTKTITVYVTPRQPGTPDLDPARDTGASNADDVTAAAILKFSGTGAVGDSTSSVRVFIDQNGNGLYDTGEANTISTLVNGAWTADGVSTTGLDGDYNVYAIVTSYTGALSSAPSGALAITIDHTAPTTTFSGIGLSRDTGSDGSDLITNVAAQTIYATLSQPLAAGDKLMGSTDNGASWTDLTARVSGTALTWNGATLVAGGGIQFKVLDQHGNAGTPTTRGYVLDLTPPSTTVASAQFNPDPGADFILGSANQNLAGALSANLAAGDIVEVSLDNGNNWTTANSAAGAAAWSLGNIVLTGSNTLQVRVTDLAGNHGTPLVRAYVLDGVAPTASVPASTQLLAPSGSSFTVTVTYADSGGSGIDAATFGIGNISVRDPDGTPLAVTGFAPSGNVVTYTVQAPGGNWDPLDAGRLAIAINANSVRDVAGHYVAANTGAGSIDVVFSTAPAVGGLALSEDHGRSATDFVTDVAAQTIQATLSKALAAGDVVQGSIDGGNSWTTITGKVDGTALAWDVTLPGAGTIVIKVSDANGLAGETASHAYTIDTGKPMQTIVSAALEFDSGKPGDLLTNVSAQSLYGTLDAPLAADEFVEVSFDAGRSWTEAVSSGATWSLAGVTVTGQDLLEVRVSDLAGNSGIPFSHPYALDADGPLVSVTRPNMVEPSGASFTFSVTYLDGTDLDPATIGPGNVTVTGPSGALSVTGASVTEKIGVLTTITYTVAAPGGSWDPLDAGVYTIGITGQLRELAGNAVAVDASAHTFTVGVNSAPALGGVFATPAIGDDASTAPFAGVTVADLDGDALSLSISYAAANGVLSGTGLAGSAGNYTLSGSPADVQAALRALVFTPTANQVAAGSVVTTFTLAASDGSASTSNSATVVTTAPVAPTATIALSDTALGAGESALLTITFSEAVTGFSAADLTMADVALGALTSSDGGRTWSATVTPVPSVALSAHQVLLDLSGVRDAGGLAGSGTATGPNYTVSTVRPSATLSVLDATLTVGETTTVTVTFSEAVSDFTLADLSAASGVLSNLSSNDGGISWTATLTPDANAWTGANTVSLDLSGVKNAVGNAGNGNVLSNPYAVQTGTAPTPPAPPGAVIDGVRVTTSRELDPVTGLVNRVVTVPVVTPSRPEDPSTPNATLADIPLTTSGGGATSTLTVGLPTGAGLQVSTPANLLNASQALTDLIRRIEQHSDGVAEQEMKGAGSAFLQGLAGGTMLQTATLAPMAAASGVRDIVVTGDAPGGAIGLVIDATGLPLGATVQLNNVDFAAVAGAVILRGGLGNNTVVGDGASQNIFLGEGDDALYGGGGDDIIGSAGGADLLDGGSGNDMLAGGIGNDRLAGGSGDDVLQGGRSTRGDWQFTLAGGQLSASHQTAVFAPGARETLAVGELDRGAVDLAFLSASQARLTDMALLYQAAFGRAPDLGGLNFYLNKGVDAAALARDFAGSREWIDDGLQTMGNAAFVRQLYRQVLEREGESSGVAFWAAKLTVGAASRAEVLQAFALSAEHRALHADGLVIAQGVVAQENGWILGSGDDRLDGGAGSDLLVGGDGIDTVVYAGLLADYRFLLGADGAIKVADRANSDVDTLLGVERGEFRDGTVDLAFTQSAASVLGTVGLLYQAVLDRAGDMGGLSWWAASRADTDAIVRAFAGSGEFAARYGAMSNADFVGALYANSGLDAAQAGGSAGWVAMLQDHTRAELIGAWIMEDAVRDAQFGIQGLWLA